MNTIIHLLRDTAALVLMLVFRAVPINEHKIVFKSLRGSRYNDNPRAIFIKMQLKHPEYDYVWVMKDPSVRIEGARTVKANSIKELYELATARVWIDNKRKGLWAIKRRGQFYMQTWHNGGFPLKKAEKDAIKDLPKYYIMCAKLDSKRADVFLSGCRKKTMLYRSAFWYDGKVLECGMPAEDVLFNSNDQSRKAIEKLFGLTGDYKFVLYAPTFRSDGDVSCYDIDYRKLLAALKEKWPSNWKVIIRLHPNISEKQGMLHYDADILNGSSVEDIFDLISACDLMISDYSGSIGQAAEAGKRVIMYASDWMKYKEERDTYIQMDQLPFPFATTNEELVKIIRSFDDERYFRTVEDFMKDCGYYPNHGAADYCAEYIFEITEKQAARNMPAQ